MTTSHIHADQIKAWADGAKIQREVSQITGTKWVDDPNPSWNPLNKYRVKPEGELVIYCKASPGTGSGYISQVDRLKYVTDNLKLVFHGDTGELVSAEVLKQVKTLKEGAV